ncbi:hypothetical protein K7432_011517 [Basidiobolus ranarum]|uniref:Uncharacterized protein n=1 Tax=Basidiobolus ranarum TaxID=34480 RepID=A0ABR2VUQ3_9FUNG
MNYLTNVERVIVNLSSMESKCEIKQEDYLTHHQGIEESKFILQKVPSTFMGFNSTVFDQETETETETEEASSQNNDELEMKIRDFAYSESDPRHLGEYVEQEDEE